MRSMVLLSFCRFVSILVVVLLLPVAAMAQTEGRVSVGGSMTFVSPTDDDVDSVVTGGPLVRLNPRKGWGVAGALNWFRADLKNPAGGDADFARLRVRPLMAGASYTVGSDRTLISFSVVAGPSFNKAEFRDSFLDTQSGTPAIDAENSIAIRPGVSVTQSVARRVGVVGFAGYMFNRPDVAYRNTAGQEFTDQWKADALVLSVGLVYSIF
jgi:Outer membrane protein beta-barrel domain